MKNTILVDVKCPFCGTSKAIEVPQSNYNDWRNGKLAQHAFPTLSLDDREQLISGVCPKCWNQTFGDEE